MEGSYLKTVEHVCDFFSTNLKQGLSRDGVVKLRKRFGRNVLPPPSSTSFFKLVIKQFEDNLVLILLASAVISFILTYIEENETFMSACIEPCIIFTILIANAIVGVFQETNAEKAIEKLKDYEARKATVIRESKAHVIESSELVPGDLIRVAVGDKIPADCRLAELTSSTLSCDESMLTGEPIPVLKQIAAIFEPDQMKRLSIVNQDKVNLLFSGSLVVKGRGLAIVVKTGSDTELGKIQSGLVKKRKDKKNSTSQTIINNEDEEEETYRTPLQQKLDHFAQQLSKAILFICLLVWIVNIQSFQDHGGYIKGAIYYFKIAVALAVAAIPEGLPAVVTTCLALGTIKMAKKNAIVRSLPSVETLGCTTIICSDKTGTLTTNKMSVRYVVVLDSVGNDIKMKKYHITGNDFSPYGQITDYSSGEVLEFPAVSHFSLRSIGKIGSLCNESKLVYKIKNNKDVFGISGEATEAAINVLSEKIGISDQNQMKELLKTKNHRERIHAASNFWLNAFEKRQLFDFSRGRKSMSVLCVDKTLKKEYLYVKGAPESIIKRCSNYVTNNGSVSKMNPNICAQINNEICSLTKKGFRVLAFAYREHENGLSQIIDDVLETYKEEDEEKQFSRIESDMTFVGITGMLDPPRPEVSTSIKKCHKAGIRVIVITGDNQSTAEAICRQIGIFNQNESSEELAKNMKSVNGSQFMLMSESEQSEIVLKADLFSRVEPSHKNRLVKILKKHGNHVVAMTGDGVNDAPALRKADIGIAMGTGTAVARHASDMILEDDNFSTIVNAVEEGRAIYANIKQFIRYLISSNIGEVFCIFLTALIGMPEALIPVQLLWVNLVTDGLPATALGFNRPDSDIMNQPPRGRNEKIINGWMFFRYFIIGLYIGLGSVLGFIFWFCYSKSGPQITFEQLTHFHTCFHHINTKNTLIFDQNFNCAIFNDTRIPSSVSLSVLVTIEMFNTFNALSENQSLLKVKPWDNIYVVFAVLLSFILHFLILYIPFFASIFKTAPLSLNEWIIVLLISFPVILLDEFLKCLTRRFCCENKGKRVLKGQNKLMKKE